MAGVLLTLATDGDGSREVELDFSNPNRLLGALNSRKRNIRAVRIPAGCSRETRELIEKFFLST